MKLSHLAFAVALATLGASASAVTMVSAQLGVNPNFSGGTGPVSSVDS
jgi:pseudouridine-5'-phosphate glycosidase